MRLAALAALLACVAATAGCGNDAAVGEPVDRPPTAFDASYRTGWRIGCRRAAAILAARQAEVPSCSQPPAAGAAIEDTAEPGDAYELGIAEACAKFLDPPEYDRCLTQRRPNE